jgi:hypothetical protein
LQRDEGDESRWRRSVDRAALEVRVESFPSSVHGIARLHRPIARPSRDVGPGYLDQTESPFVRSLLGRQPLEDGAETLSDRRLAVSRMRCAGAW